MAANSSIQWTDHTWNPWHGCKKVSPGCKFCYMYRDKDRYGQDPTNVLRSAPSTFNKPLSWKEPAKVFTCSWSDFFIEEADAWRDDAWAVIRATPHLTYQILTKRPERIKACLPKDWGEGYENVWLGVSCENQEMFDLRARILYEIPAKIRFVSFEPLLGAIDIMPIFDRYAFTDRWLIDWAIIGGESGNDIGPWKYRQCDLYWIEQLAADLSCVGVPVFIKQLGTHLAKSLSLKDRSGGDAEEFDLLKNRFFPI